MRKLVGLLALIMVTALSGCFGATHNRNPGDDQQLMNVFDGPGDTATVSGEGSGYPCYDTIDTLNAAAGATANKDDVALQAAMTHAIRLHQGQRVSVLGNSSQASGGAVQIRIQSESNAGTACWLAGDVPGGIFRDIHFADAQ